jgi:hypothetical protein
MASHSAPFASTHELARAIIILTIIGAALSIASMVYEATGDLSSDVVFFSDPWLASLLAISILVGILEFILFLLWYYRNHRNLGALGASELRFTPGWAVVWWFIPILNLWKPYQVTVEVMKASDPAIGRTDSETRKTMRRPPYVLAWWLFNFMAVGVIILAYIIASPEAEVATRAPEMSWFVVVQVIITVIGSWLTIKVVREIDMRQAKKIELVRSGGYGTP